MYLAYVRGLNILPPLIFMIMENCLHFGDKVIEVEKLNNIPKVTQQINGTDSIQAQACCSQGPTAF